MRSPFLNKILSEERIEMGRTEKTGFHIYRKNGSRSRKLSIGILQVMLVGWLLPLTVMSACVFFVVSGQLERQTRETIQESADTAADICEMRLLSSIQASRNASYIPTIKENWKSYQADGNEQKLYDGVYEFISQMYKYDENFLSTMVYFKQNPEKLYYIYSSIADADYDSVCFFREKAKEDADSQAKSIDTGIGFLCRDGHTYMIRNIVDKSFAPFAVIAMELDKKSIFQSLKGIGWFEDACVYIDGVCAYSGDGRAAAMGDEREELSSRRSVYVEDNGRAYVGRRTVLEGHEIRYVVMLDYDAIRYERSSMVSLFLVFLISTVPLVLLIFRFLYRNVSAPVKRLVESAHEIEIGNFGYQIISNEQSEEFSYLTGAFNSMSDKLKNQFEQIYLEELALKDADIKALQSQINPHFLNNTLEIINWEARMNGNDKVSSMIEALSTMLEATRNRKRQPMIPLAEELEYVNAFCYICQQRFGEKLQFEKQIDNTLLAQEVPRLIIQPIIENAVEHGLAGKRGKIDIRIYQKRAIRLGVTRFLLKPSKIDEIEEAIQAMTARLKELGAEEQGIEEKEALLTADAVETAEVVDTEKVSDSDSNALPQDAEEENPASSFIVRNALDYIGEHYKQKLKLADVAEKTYVSQWHLSKLLNRYTGKSFSDILNNVRIEKAKELLNDPSLRIGDIAEEVGFLDVAHFSRVFKKQVGISANEYRNSLAGK